MSRKLLFSFSLGFLGLSGAYAQSNGQIRVDSTNKNTTTTIIITQQNASTYFPSQAGVKQDMAIKINPLLILSGDLPVYVERRISEKLSVEVGAGLTIQNYSRDFWERGMDDDGLEDDTRQFNLGYSIMAGLRMYPSDNTYALDGFYFAPEFRHRTYNVTVTHVEGEQLDKPLDRQTKMTDFKIMFGKMEYVDDNIFFDFYLGTGIRNKLEQKYETNYDYNYDFAGITPKTEKNSVVTLSMGVKVGFAF